MSISFPILLFHFLNTGLKTDTSHVFVAILLSIDDDAHTHKCPVPEIALKIYIFWL